MTIKQMKLANTNQRLAYDVFPHICPAPQKALSYDEVEDTIFEIYTPGVEPFKSKLIEYMPYSFSTIPNLLTLWAYGIESDTFREQWKDQHPTTQANDQFAVYFFKKLAN